jgi:two-component system, OmpR family, alkaline phosphatase synthesis response regulator PhoP
MKKILIIDDDQDFIDWVTTGLSREDFEITAAETGKKGLEAAKSVKPDAVILDIYLPDADGVELCRQIKGDKDLKNTSVILVTGVFKEIDSIEKGYQSGADDFLIKPFSYDQLRIRVLRQLRK